MYQGDCREENNKQSQQTTASHDRAIRTAAERFTPTSNCLGPSLVLSLLKGFDRTIGPLHFDRVFLGVLVGLWDWVPPLEGLSMNLPLAIRNLNFN